jgi:hypothetical protein
MQPFDVTREEVRSFDGQFYRFTTISGPIRLIRFSDSGRGAQGRLGRYWLYGSELVDILRMAPSIHALVKEISQRWAICDDWGDKRLMWWMDVPAGQAVPAAWGRAKFQPKVSETAQGTTRTATDGTRVTWRETCRSYPGGSLQLLIPVVDTDQRVNAFLASLVRGPVSTDTVAASPRRFLATGGVRV